MAYLPNGYRGREVMVTRNRTMSDAIRTIAADHLPDRSGDPNAP
jgi:hypothetical protein